MRKKECPACSGTGLLAPALPSCSIPALKYPWIVVEKCDCCDVFPDDVSAGLSKFKIVGWFLCTDGGDHALANLHSRRINQALIPSFPQPILQRA